jgi:hypothetical protein
MSTWHNSGYVGDPWAHCAPPPEGSCDLTGDIIDASGIWIIIREYMRARHPDKMAACDAAFYDAYVGGCLDGQQFKAKHGWVFDIAGPFSAEIQEYMQQVGTFGGNAAECTIDYRTLACMTYWLATMDQAQRQATIEAMKQGMVVQPVCGAVASDPSYGSGPRPTAQYPPVPMDASGQSIAKKKGLSTGQKIGIAVGVAAAAVIAGIAVS